MNKKIRLALWYLFLIVILGVIAVFVFRSHTQTQLLQNTAGHLNTATPSQASTTQRRSLGEGYFQDWGHVYFGSTTISDSYQFDRIDGQPYTGAQSYENWSCDEYSYWSDGQEVYYAGKSLGISPENIIFEIYPGIKCDTVGYVWNWKQYFYHGALIPGVDPTSFRIIKNEYARDAYHAYDAGQVMVGDPDYLEKNVIPQKIQQELKESDDADY